MANKRTADGFKKASLTGKRQFKQTKLNFGSFASSRAHRPHQAPANPQDASSKPTTSPETPEQERPGQTVEEATTQPERKRVSPSRLNFNMEASKENKPPPPSPSRPLQAPQQSSSSSSEQPQEAPQPSNNPTNQNPGPLATNTTQLIRITDIEGDLFAAPPNTVLIHACNALGSWGGGIALAFKKSYPEAFKIYNAHCRQYSSDPRTLVGTALLIPPPSPSALPSSAATAAAASSSGLGSAGGGPNNMGKGRIGAGSSAAVNEARKQHWIGCLFTSKAYGRGRDSPRDILDATAPALGHLMRLISVERTKRKKGDGPGEMRMCQINSGLFDVPWKDTKRVVADMTGEDVLERHGGKDDDDDDDDGDGEVLSGLGDLPVRIGAYWRQDLQR